MEDDSKEIDSTSESVSAEESSNESPEKTITDENSETEDSEKDDEPPKTTITDENSEPEEDSEKDDEESEDEDSAVTAHDPLISHFCYDLPETTPKDDKLTYQLEPHERTHLGHMSYSRPKGYSTGTCPTISPKKDGGLSQFTHLKKNLSEKCKELTPVQLDFLGLVSEYADVTFMQRTKALGKAFRDVWVLHLTNHILKSKAKVIHHNSKLAKNPDKEFRDQGFAGPTVLVMVPFRHDCYLAVKSLCALLPEAVVTNKKRFEKEYKPSPQPPKRKKKSKEFEDTFEGNTDEDFKIGLQIKNKSITLYSEFYHSDLVIASPLGLRQVIGAEGDKKRDYDFLSSIEILIMDRIDVLYLQNLIHLCHVLKHINLLPKDSHGCNFFRVRMYALDGFAKFFRQTILLSAVEHMWFETVIPKTFCSNYKGYLRSIASVKSKGVSQIFDTVKLCFRIFDYEGSAETEVEQRFQFFVSKVLPDFRDPDMAQTLIYVPTYYDYIKIRNYLRSQEISAVMVCEYSEPGKVAEARNNFFHGRRHFMVYTERTHFYHRYTIKGVQHLLFYQPPTHPAFFRDLNFFFLDSHPKRKDELKTCTVVASRMDLLQLKHMVGMQEAQRMLNSEEKVFVKLIQR